MRTPKSLTRKPFKATGPARRLRGKWFNTQYEVAGTHTSSLLLRFRNRFSYQWRFEFLFIDMQAGCVQSVGRSFGP